MKIVKSFLGTLTIEIFALLRVLFGMIRFPISNLLFGPVARFCFVFSLGLCLVASMYVKNVGGMQGHVNNLFSESNETSQPKTKVEGGNESTSMLSKVEYIYLGAIFFTMFGSGLNLLGGLFGHWFIKRMSFQKRGVVLMLAWAGLLFLSTTAFLKLQNPGEVNTYEWAFLGMLISLGAVCLCLAESIRESSDIVRLECDAMSGYRVLSDSYHEYEKAEMISRRERQNQRGAEILRRQSAEAEIMG